jgi:hypothetical protein
MITKINAAVFHELLKRDEQVVVKFGAGWCNACTAQTVQLNELEEEVFEIDVDQYSELSASLGIMTIPRLKVFKSEKLVREHVHLFKSTDEAVRFIQGV